jgi:hypothetical protein
MKISGIGTGNLWERGSEGVSKLNEPRSGDQKIDGGERFLRTPGGEGAVKSPGRGERNRQGHRRKH